MKICNELSIVKHKIFHIGVQLGVPRYKMKEFKKEDDPLSATIEYWLDGNVEDASLTWQSVVDALRSEHVGEIGRADAIYEKYCVSQGQPFPSLMYVVVLHILGKIGG